MYDGQWYAMKRFGEISEPADDTSVYMARREMDKARVTQLQAHAVVNQSFIVRLFAIVTDVDYPAPGKAMVYELCDGDVGGVVTAASNGGKYIQVSCCLRFSDSLTCCWPGSGSASHGVASDARS